MSWPRGAAQEHLACRPWAPFGGASTAPAVRERRGRPAEAVLSFAAVRRAEPEPGAFGAFLVSRAASGSVPLVSPRCWGPGPVQYLLFEMHAQKVFLLMLLFYFLSFFPPLLQRAILLLSL